ncbi:MAG: AI-2E family transporter [Halothiobacillaceae bacterium]
MLSYLKDWFDRHFSDPQVVILALLLILGSVVVLYAGKLLAPLIASVVVAYLLEGAVRMLRGWGLPRMPAVMLVFMVFLSVFIASIFLLAPLMVQQLAQLFREAPAMISKGQEVLLQLPENYPQLVSEQQIREVIGTIRAQITSIGQQVVMFSLNSVVHLVTFLVYLVLVPLLVFFMLKDKDVILAWALSFLPQERGLANLVWADVNAGIGSYVRGKFIEILIVWSVSYVTFALLGLEYAMLLSFLTGVSVIIPYIGAFVVALPVAVVAYFQFGLEPMFWWVVVAYTVIQFLDGNVLVPLLFSEVVNLHPVAIIAAVIIFGGLWGLWGVFFAIPLATLVAAVLNAWPTRDSAAAADASETPCTDQTETESA